MAIASNPVSNESYNPNSISSRWGITANEYTVDGARVDLQDLMVLVSKKRAAAVEGEVAPQATRIRNRNAELEELGEALAELTKIQAMFEGDDKGDKHMPEDEWMSKKTGDLLVKLGYSSGDYDSGFHYESGSGYCATKAMIEGMAQTVKSEIDGRNNEAQLDMSRLQQLVDRRDESYSTATNLMTAISDTRANLIRNL